MSDNEMFGEDDIARPSAAQRLCQYLRAPWYEPDLFNNFARNQEEPIMNDHPNSPADTAADDDMTAARNALLSKLPMELVDQVMDHAEYWGSSKLGFSESVIVSNTTNGNGTKIVLRSAPIGLRTTDLPDQYWNQMPPPQPVMPNDKLQSPRAFNQLLSTTPPSGSHPVRKVVFTLRSRDQGWASHRREPGSSEYSSSWTWFDVGLERFSETDCLEKQKNGTCPHDQLPTYFGETFTACRLRTVLPLRLQDQEEDGTALDIPDSPGSKYNIQRNRQANSEAKTHIITWRADDNEPLGSEADVDADWKGSGRGTLTGDWVRSLQVGDVITVWAKARFGGWRNIISEVSVEVFWAV